MRRNGHQNHAFERRVQNRAARGQRIRRGARSRRTNDAVGGLTGHLLIVDIDEEIDHAARTPVADADVVHGELPVDFLAVTQDDSFEQGSFVADALTRKHFT